MDQLKTSLTVHTVHVSVMPRGTRVALDSLPVAGGVAATCRRQGHQYYVRSAHIAVV